MKVRRIDWSPDEWLAGTARVLTQREAAVYMAVLMVIYSRGSACPNDAAFIAGQFAAEDGAHRTAQWLTRHTRRALDRLIELGKLRVSPDGAWLTNGRADAELGKAGERIVGAARAGYASGRARRARMGRLSDADGTPVGKPVSSNSNGLARTAVRIINHQPSKSTDLSNDTEAAREPSPEPQASQARAPTPSNEGAKINSPRSSDRLTDLAARARAKFLKEQS